MSRWASVLAVLLACVLYACDIDVACAEDLVHELKGGVLWHDVPNLWSGFTLETDSRVDINGEVIFSPSIGFLYGTFRPALGATVNTGHGTDHAYLDARWELELPWHFFLGTGVGAAVHDGDLAPDHIDKKALGSRVLFHFPLELGYRLDDHNSFSAYFEHTSNGNTVRYNEGLDRLGVRYGYRF